MQADPGQKTDIAEQNQPITKKLRHAYERWFNDVTLAGSDRLPIPVGYDEAPEVNLPAHECYMEGQVRYAGKGGHGWAHDWVTNWTSIDDRVWWDIDVVKSGRFEVTLVYDCPAEDVGAKFRIDVGEEQVKGTIRTSRGVEIIATADRAPQAGVHERAWASTTPGALEIKKGRHKLTVRALTIPGKTAFDVKGVLLRRLD
jgi:arylsulfatase A